MGRIRVRYSTKRLRHDSRTLAMYGSPDRGNGLDHGKWFRCWNCKMPNHIERDALGDAYSTDGVVLEDYAQQLTEGGIRETRLNTNLVASENDSNGDPKTVRHSFMVSSGSRGCRFCHTLNWRGDF